MPKTKEELEKEQQGLLVINQELDKKKNEVLTRLVEIQGILKYLKENDNDK